MNQQNLQCPETFLTNGLDDLINLVLGYRRQLKRKYSVEFTIEIQFHNHSLFTVLCSLFSLLYLHAFCNVTVNINRNTITNTISIWMGPL